MPDNEPQPSNNPFIRFRRHVDSNISSGLSVITGRPPPPASSTSPANNHDNSDTPTNPPPPARTSMGSLDTQPRRSTAQTYWNEWAQLSPYSPHNLRHLPPPRPNDLDSDTDAALLGFDAAFEDLLAASAARPPLDLRRHAAYQRSVLADFRGGEPPLVWADRLCRAGLLPRPRDESPRQQPHDAEGKPGLHDVLMEGAGWNREKVEEWRKSLDQDFVFNPGKMIAQAEELFRETIKSMQQQQHKYDDETEEDDYDHDQDNRKKAADDEFQKRFDAAGARNDGRHHQPATEEDLFSAVWNSSRDAGRSAWDDMFKVFTESSSRRDTAAAKTERPRENEVVEHDAAGGGKTIRSTTEHVDVFGYLHQKTEVRRVDAHGREFSRETQYSVRPAPARDESQVEGGGRAPTPTVVAASQDKAAAAGERPTGWFWR